MSIEEILNIILPLPEASRALLVNNIVAVRYSKGHMLIRANSVGSSIYFISKGIVRAFAKSDDTEITFWFGMEGDAVISMRSYVSNEPGYEDIELLEDCALYEISHAHLQQLYSKDIHIANWGRKFAERELVRTEERLISRQFRTATQRYRELMATAPELLQRVALSHIASYLGITQVSLSRIRADIK